ncbi:MAG: succinate CoA transferase [Puniceicoccales bacterium]|jgi:acetyl-CoA hydrolase|nr:succinate CoA transferase [Puniceicoccales bacterium]
MTVRHHNISKRFSDLTASEAAMLIQNGQCVACSGFTPAGCAKAVPRALGERASSLHQLGENFRIKLLSGASTGDCIDGALSRANAIECKIPYQANKDLRTLINAGHIAYADLHLSRLCPFIHQGLWGPIHWAIVEVADYSQAGELLLTGSVGATPTFCQHAEKIILEHNTYHPTFIQGLHDIYTPSNPPHRKIIPLENVHDRIGTHVVQVDPQKIVGVVHTCEPDNVSDFKASNPIDQRIGELTAEFFIQEMENGRIPSSFLPIQSGVGNIANAVLKTMGEQAKIPPFAMYSEVAQNAVIELIQEESIYFASATALTVTNTWFQHIYNHWDFYKSKLVLRPEEITNHPEIIQRIGLLSLNTALEVDCFGNVNSTHICGNAIVNGIGGSGDFTRNAYISIFVLPSTTKNGTISGIVPFCSHIDHTEHDVQIIVTEQGIADLRGKSPTQRATCIVENCAHPDYKPLLRDYLRLGQSGHIKHDLNHAFSFHNAFLKTGDMRLCQFD